MVSKIKNENNDFLFEAILQLKTVDECYDFFEDLCTVNELKSISQRLAVAKMLRDGNVYSDIVAATISRVNRSLLYGSNGYEGIFQRLEKNKKD